MTNFLKFILFFLIISGCSLSDKTGFWSKEKNLDKVQNEFKPFFKKDKRFLKEFNNDFNLKIDPSKINLNVEGYLDNNDGYIEYVGELKKVSKYNFSKIDNYEKIEPELIFFKNDVIFFDNKGTILSFNQNSRLNWKKNIYSKNEKKLRPFLSMNMVNDRLIVTDNISRYYALNVKDGSVIWSKNHVTPFNSQIKIFKKLFFVVDANNSIICYSVDDGEKVWSFSTEKPFINSLKKLSIVIKNDLVIFNNSLGDITALDVESGMLEWQRSTQNSENINELMNLKTSDLIIDNDSIYFSNNKNNFYSIDLKTGSINWKQKISSFIKPSVVDNLIFTLSEKGYFFVVEKNTGNIIRINNIFKGYKKKKNFITPTGFVFNSKEIFISTNKGKLFVLNLENGLIKNIINVTKNKISRPYVKNNSMYLVKDSSILKLN